MSCNTSKNIAKPCETKQYGTINRVYLSPIPVSETYADALLQATYTSLINAEANSRLYILPAANDATPTNEDPIKYEGSLNIPYKVRDGKQSHMFQYFDLPDCLWDNVKNLDNKLMYALYQTETETILGASDGTNFKSIPVFVMVSKVKSPENKDTPWIITVEVSMLNPEDGFTKAIQPSKQTVSPWLPSTLDGIKDVEFTAVSQSDSEVIVYANADCDGSEVVGLVTADFDVTGLASVAADAIEPNKYILTPTSTFTSPLLIGLKNQPAMTTKGFECQTALSVTF